MNKQKTNKKKLIELFNLFSEELNKMKNTNISYDNLINEVNIKENESG